MSRISIFGAGAWGTALALSLSRRPEHTVTLWSRSSQHVRDLLSALENEKYLPGSKLPVKLAVTNDLAEAAGRSEILLSAIPSAHTRSHFELLAPLLRPGQIVISATKGIENGTLLRMSEVIDEVLRSRGLMLLIGALGGPSFAQEVAAGLPTVVTIAFRRMDQAARIQAEFSTPGLRLYRNEDIIGVELGGALKNVIAIAAGAVAGSGLGQNATSALITRGIAEMTRLALACGGRSATLAGLSGVGDLVLTCTGALSRNRLVGFELGRGQALPDVLASLNGRVAEGLSTTAAALALAARHGVEMPIASQVAAVLRGERSTEDAVRELMQRAARDE